MASTSTRDPGLAIVAGGSGGHRLCHLPALAADGQDIALTYRSNAEGGAHVMAECEALGVRARADAVDLTDPAALRRHVDAMAAAVGYVLRSMRLDPS